QGGETQGVQVRPRAQRTEGRVEQFGGDVLERPFRAGDLAGGEVDPGRLAELDVATAGDEQVGRLDGAVQSVVVMDDFQAGQGLRQDTADQVGGQWAMVQLPRQVARQVLQDQPAALPVDVEDAHQVLLILLAQPGPDVGTLQDLLEAVAVLADAV